MNVQDKAYNWVKQIDFFCKPITLNMNGDTVYKTFLGGISTFLISFIMLVFFYNTINSFLNKEQMFSDSSRYFTDDPPFIKLNSQNMMFAVSIQQTNFLTNPYYDIKIEHRNDTRNDQGRVQRIVKEFPLEPCTLEHWQQLPRDYDWEAKFKKMNFSDWLCPKQDYEMELGGVYSSNSFSYYKISVVKCVDDLSKNKKCRTQQEIADNLAYNDGSMRFQLYQSNNIVNPDSQNPVLSYLSDVTQFLFSPGKLFITGNLFYSQTTLTVNNNIWFGETLQATEIPYFSQSETTTQYIPGQEKAFASFFMRKSMFQDAVKRDYQKVDSLISYIGGFAQSIFFIVSFIIGFFNEREFQIELANKLYDFEVKKLLDHPSEIKRSSNQIRESLRSSEHKNTLTEGQKIREIIKNTASRRRRNAVILNQFDPIIDQLKSFQASLSPPSEQESPIETRHDHQLNREIRNLNSCQSTKSGTRAESQDSESHEQNLIIFDKQPLSKIRKNLQIICEEDSRKEDSAQLSVSDKFSSKKMSSSPQNKEKQQSQISMNFLFSTQLDTEDNDKFIGSKRSFTDQAESNKMSQRLIQLIDLKEISQQKQQDLENNFTYKANRDKYEQEQKVKAANTIARFIRKKQFAPKEQTKNTQKLNSLNNQIKEIKKQGLYRVNRNEDKDEYVGGKFNFKSRRSFLINQFQELISRQNKVTIHIKYYLNKLCCGKYFNCEENKLIDRAQEEINKDLDVFYMIERIKEVDKLKKIIFDKEQQILFNFCPKPIIKLKDDNTILTRTQLQSRVKSNTTTAQNNSSKAFPKQRRSVFQQGKLLKHTLQAVSQFKKGIQKNQFLEINIYKYLYEAYDTIMELDPKLDKRKNKSLINQLGDEMRDIFKTSKLIKFESKQPITKKIKPIITDNLAEYYDKDQKQDEGQTDQQELDQDNQEYPQKIAFSRKIKRQQTFKEISLQDSLEDIDKDEQQKPSAIYEEEEDQDEEKSENQNQNQKELIHFSSESLSIYSQDVKKQPQNELDQIEDLFTKRVSLQQIDGNNKNEINFDNAQILVTEEPQQTQQSDISFNQNNNYFIQDQNINTIFSPKQDEDHPFQKNRQQGNLFQMGTGSFASNGQSQITNEERTSNK